MLKNNELSSITPLAKNILPMLGCGAEKTLDELSTHLSEPADSLRLALNHLVSLQVLEKKYDKSGKIVFSRSNAVNEINRDLLTQLGFLDEFTGHQFAQREDFMSPLLKLYRALVIRILYLANKSPVTGGDEDEFEQGELITAHSFVDIVAKYEFITEEDINDFLSALADDKHGYLKRAEFEFELLYFSPTAKTIELDTIGDEQLLSVLAETDKALLARHVDSIPAATTVAVAEPAASYSQPSTNVASSDSAPVVTESQTMLFKQLISTLYSANYNVNEDVKLDQDGQMKSKLLSVYGTYAIMLVENVVSGISPIVRAISSKINRSNPTVTGYVGVLEEWHLVEKLSVPNRKGSKWRAVTEQPCFISGDLVAALRKFYDLSPTQLDLQDLNRYSNTYLPYDKAVIDEIRAEFANNSAASIQPICNGASFGQAANLANTANQPSIEGNTAKTSVPAPKAEAPAPQAAPAAKVEAPAPQAAPAAKVEAPAPQAAPVAKVEALAPQAAPAAKVVSVEQVELVAQSQSTSASDSKSDAEEIANLKQQIAELQKKLTASEHNVQHWKTIAKSMRDTVNLFVDE